MMLQTTAKGNLPRLHKVVNKSEGKILVNIWKISLQRTELLEITHTKNKQKNKKFLEPDLLNFFNNRISMLILLVLEKIAQKMPFLLANMLSFLKK